MKQKEQLIPVVLTIIICLLLVGILYTTLHALNLFPLQSKILLKLTLVDVLVGLTIYLKTAIDFAIFIGNLMTKYPGWKNRIAIEIGTASGNAIGTILILIVWTFFKEVPLLLFLMIVLAALVLFQMAQEGLEDYLSSSTFSFASSPITALLSVLKKINLFFQPITKWLLPSVSLKQNGPISFRGLFLFSLSVPFILGLDDFAGYIPLFSIINIFGFATGVFVGHMILNLALFANPKATTKLVRLPLVLAIGSIAFVGLGLWGFYEAFHILARLF